MSEVIVFAVVWPVDLFCNPCGSDETMSLWATRDLAEQEASELGGGYVVQEMTVRDQPSSSVSDAALTSASRAKSAGA